MKTSCVLKKPVFEAFHWEGDLVSLFEWFTSKEESLFRGVNKKGALEFGEQGNIVAEVPMNGYVVRTPDFKGKFTTRAYSADRFAELFIEQSL